MLGCAGPAGLSALTAADGALLRCAVCGLGAAGSNPGLGDGAPGVAIQAVGLYLRLIP